MKFTAQQFFTSTLTAGIFVFLGITPTFAWNSYNSYTMPSFGNCPNPGGSQMVNYQDGWHWIQGVSGNQWGSDNVYSMGNNNFTQCFCPKVVNTQNYDSSKQAIQTNWLYEGNISSQERNQLLQSGWSEQNGSDFGLPSGMYVAKNITYSCNQQTCPTTYRSTDNQKNYSNKENNTYQNNSEYKSNSYTSNNNTLQSYVIRNYSISTNNGHTQYTFNK